MLLATSGCAKIFITQLPRAYLSSKLFNEDFCALVSAELKYVQPPQAPEAKYPVIWGREYASSPA